MTGRHIKRARIELAKDDGNSDQEALTSLNTIVKPTLGLPSKIEVDMRLNVEIF